MAKQMGEATGFTCGTCRNRHDGIIRDIAFRLPDEVAAIPKNERAARARFNNDLCDMRDGRFFIRCLLRVPFRWSSDYFGWGVWIEVAEPDFRAYLDIYNADGSNEPRRPGKLANRIAGCDDAVGEPVIVAFGSSKERPLVYTHPDSTSSLARDQRDGITDERHYDLIADLVPAAVPPADDIACLHILERGAPVLNVLHFESTWEFVCGPDEHDDVEFHVLHRGHLFKQHPSLAAIADLAVGEEADRDSKDEPWTRSRFNDDN